jgi:hypothetical protein
MRSMRVVAAIGLGSLFALGALAGLLLGVLVIFWVSLIRGARAVHAQGVVCRAELGALDDVVGPRIAGAAIVRLSGAFESQTSTTSDVLGLDIRMRRPEQAESLDSTVGDQDLSLGTFRSFLTAVEDRADTDVADYLANEYSSVTPWWVPGRGPSIFRLVPPPKQPPKRGACDHHSASLRDAAHPGKAGACDRVARLDADMEAGRARMTMTIDDAPVAELRLVERLAIDGKDLRVSMFRQGRAIRPVGFRNGVRATVYPISELGRRIRGG